MIGRAAYRVRQALANLAARMSPDDWALVGRLLSLEEKALFERMEAVDQRHSVQVARRLMESGATDPALLKAALLHDVGKSRCRIGILPRTLAVLAAHVPGRLPSWLARECDRGWRLPFHVLARHHEIGAELLAQAGCDERVCRLVQLHQSDIRRLGSVPNREWLQQSLALLQRADGQS